MSGRSQKIRAGEVTLHVREWGEGRPLLLLHGLGMRTDLWVHQVEAFSAVRRMIAIDLRGFGESDRPRGEGAYAIERFTDDVVALVEALGLRDLDLLGTSMGGFVAESVALRAPDRLASLVLCHTASRMSIPPDVLETRLEALRTVSMQEYGRLVSAQALAPGAPAALADWLTALVERNDRESYSRVLAEGLASFDLGERVAAIRVPTRVIVGEHDRVIPPEAGRELAALIPGAELVEIAGVGHIGYAERPAEFNQAVLEFLDRSEHGRAGSAASRG